MHTKQTNIQYYKHKIINKCNNLDFFFFNVILFFIPQQFGIIQEKLI
jgi:hypothetical protein